MFDNMDSPKSIMLSDKSQTRTQQIQYVSY